MNKHMSLADVMTSVNTAKGLPNAHYVDAETFEIEKQAVLFANWAGIGFGKDIPEPGDAMPVEFLGLPLLMVRDHEGQIGVFQNTCRHRGMILVDKPQKIKGAIRCPYHSWAYTLQGDLRTAPHVGGVGKNSHEDVNFAELGLIRFAAHVWRDVVFVNIDGQAAPFTEVHADLIKRWGDFEQDQYHGGATSSFKLNVATNWKLAVENYCESYHLPWVHPELNQISKLEDHYNIEAPGQYSGQGSYIYQQLTGENGAQFDLFPGLDKKWESGAEYVAVFPNVLLGVHCDHSFAIVLEPQGIDRTVEHIELYYARPPSETSALEPLRVANAKQWKAVFEEDIFVVEGMQRGRKGSYFDGGRFSPAMDGPTHCFHHWIASQITKAS